MSFNRSNLEEKESKPGSEKDWHVTYWVRLTHYFQMLGSESNDRGIKKSEIVEETPNDLTLKPQRRS